MIELKKDLEVNCLPFAIVVGRFLLILLRDHLDHERKVASVLVATEVARGSIAWLHLISRLSLRRWERSGAVAGTSSRRSARVAGQRAGTEVLNDRVLDGVEATLNVWRIHHQYSVDILSQEELTKEVVVNLLS